MFGEMNEGDSVVIRSGDGQPDRWGNISSVNGPEVTVKTADGSTFVGRRDLFRRVWSFLTEP